MARLRNTVTGSIVNVSDERVEILLARGYERAEKPKRGRKSDSADDA